MFEIIKSDLAGRIGRLRTNHGTVDTPAFVPVIHPVRQSIPASEIRDMGFEMVITNAYIAKRNLEEKAKKVGIHRIIGFNGSVMTDSGGYQVLEYGGLDTTPEEMAAFETAIGSDVAVPLDKPTGFGGSKSEAERSVRDTLRAARKTPTGNGQIWTGPVQGGEYRDLVSHSARALVRYGFPMLALGSPVEFMEAYKFELVAKMITAAKIGAPSSIPLHLFGAGHPLTIPLAVALGCDTFDSASYILYAKQSRYITEDGTRHLSEMGYFSCNCPVCARHTPAELAALDESEKTIGVARHNLYAIKAEVDRVKEAIHEGRLWEYVMKKSRAHPKLFDARSVFTQPPEYLQEATPVFKSKAIFLMGEEDQFRPEVRRYHDAVRNFRTGKNTVCVTREKGQKPAYASAEYASLSSRFKDPEKIQFCQYDPYLGIIPIEISDLFPAAHHVTGGPDPRPADCTELVRTWEIFFKRNNFTEIRYDKKDKFLGYLVKQIPGRIRKVHLGESGRRAHDDII